MEVVLYCTFNVVYLRVVRTELMLAVVRNFWSHRKLLLQGPGLCFPLDDNSGSQISTVGRARKHDIIILSLFGESE